MNDYRLHITSIRYTYMQLAWHIKVIKTKSIQKQNFI
jgi:hypothetical protein